MATKPMSLRIPEEVKLELDRIAQRFGTTPATLGAGYLAEGVRTSNHPAIEFRHTPAGRMAYLKGIRLPVWLAMQTVEDCDGDVAKAAKLLRVPELLFRAAMNYAAAYPGDIDSDREVGKRPLEELERLVPNHSFLRI